MTVTLERREQRITKLHLYWKNVKAEPCPMFGTSTETVDLGAAIVREGSWILGSASVLLNSEPASKQIIAHRNAHQ